MIAGKGFRKAPGNLLRATVTASGAAAGLLVTAMRAGPAMAAVDSRAQPGTGLSESPAATQDAPEVWPPLFGPNALSARVSGSLVGQEFILAAALIAVAGTALTVSSGRHRAGGRRAAMHATHAGPPGHRGAGRIGIFGPKRPAGPDDLWTDNDPWMALPDLPWPDGGPSQNASPPQNARSPRDAGLPRDARPPQNARLPQDPRRPQDTRLVRDGRPLPNARPTQNAWPDGGAWPAQNAWPARPPQNAGSPQNTRPARDAWPVAAGFPPMVIVPEVVPVSPGALKLTVNGPDGPEMESPANVAVPAADRPTTCALVMMYPLESTITPEPTACWRTMNAVWDRSWSLSRSGPYPVTRICTTAGETFAASVSSAPFS